MLAWISLDEYVESNRVYRVHLHVIFVYVDYNLPVNLQGDAEEADF